jgi:peptidyl-prolyl cis-trans isomerase SurA
MGWTAVAVVCIAHAQTAALRAQGAVAAPQNKGVALDRVVAVVNGELVLESDVDEERRMAALQPFRDPTGTFSRDQAIERLIDRTLILQQAKLQAEAPITDAEVNAELATLRKDIPACKEYQCATDAGWQRFLKGNGFTEAELRTQWRERMEVLRYIELRFRMGIQITPREIRTYYEQTMLPEYAKQNAQPPKLEAVSDRIQEVLLQQQVSSLLGDWLKSLRAQGSVVMMQPGEMAP